MKKATKIIVALALTGGIAASVIADQNDRKQSEDAKVTTSALAEARVSYQQAAQIALAQVPGKVLSLEFEQEDDRPIWEVKVLTAAGVEHELKVSSESGEVLEHEEDD